MERCSALDTVYAFESIEENKPEEEDLGVANNKAFSNNLHEKTRNESISRNEIEEPSPKIASEVAETFAIKRYQTQAKSEQDQDEWPYKDMPDSMCEVLIKDETEYVKDEHITDHSNNTSEIICDICQKIFATNHGLKQHIRFVHEDERNFCCEICTKKFSTSHKLTWHIRDVHEKSGDFVCGFCDKRFFRDCDKVLHERMHTGEKPYQCDDCGRAFHRKEILKRHKDSLHSGIKHPCHLCKYEAKEKGHLRRHLKTVHKNTLLELMQDGHSAEFDENNENGCKLCKKMFPDKYALIEHRQVHTGEKLFSCKVCGNNYPSIAGLKKHMQIKHDEAPAESSSYKHKCEYCHKLFRDRPKLEGHRRIHTGEKPFYCEICGNNYALKDSLRTHIKQKHDDNYVKIKRENPHECDVCGQTFDKSSRLKEHVFTHTGVKPYECHLCEEKFSFTDTLARHIGTIHEKIRHKCGICDFEATTKSHLKVHVQSKHEGIRFECTQCNSTFSRKSILSKHIKTIHIVIQDDVLCKDTVDLNKP